MSLILTWLKRIVEIGILKFLASLSWRIWAGLLITLVLALAAIVVLVVLLVGVLL